MPTPDIPPVWEPPDWMVPHLEATGELQRARQLMNGHRANVMVNAPLALEQVAMAAKVQMLHMLHGVHRLVPFRPLEDGYTVVQVTHIPTADANGPVDAARLAIGMRPDKTVVVFHGVTTIGPIQSLDED